MKLLNGLAHQEYPNWYLGGHGFDSSAAHDSLVIPLMLVTNEHLIFISDIVVELWLLS